MTSPALALTMNAGSSSVRLATWALDRPPRRLAALHAQRGELTPRAAFERALGGAERRDVTVVGHRIVHGGRRSTPGPIDAESEAEIARASKLAPLHNPVALEWVREARAFFGSSVPQVAVYDTAFFARLPEAAATYALPRDLAARHGLRRLGFHGLAHESLWRAWIATRPAGGRAISLQLGSGCSASAIVGGVAVDTSMGFTPLEGLVMATRSGDLDPGLVLHLLGETGSTPEALARLLEEGSGLKGLAGTGDMSALLGSKDPAARLAVEVFCHRARKYVGAFLAVLGGADAVLLGGGIGENAPEVRARILGGLEWAGIRIDAAANEAARGRSARISAPSSQVEVHVLAVDEEALIVEHALAAIQGGEA